MCVCVSVSVFLCVCEEPLLGVAGGGVVGGGECDSGGGSGGGDVTVALEGLMISRSIGRRVSGQRRAPGGVT